MKINFKYNGTLYDVIVKFGYFFLLILSLYITIATLFCGMEPTPATQGALATIVMSYSASKLFSH